MQAGLQAYGANNAELWVRYAKFMESVGKGSGNIAWRASKQLHLPDEFTALMSVKC